MKKIVLIVLLALPNANRADSIGSWKTLVPLTTGSLGIMGLVVSGCLLGKYYNQTNLMQSKTDFITQCKEAHTTIQDLLNSAEIALESSDLDTRKQSIETMLKLNQEVQHVHHQGSGTFIQPPPRNVRTEIEMIDQTLARPIIAWTPTHAGTANANQSQSAPSHNASTLTQTIYRNSITAQEWAQILEHSHLKIRQKLEFTKLTYAACIAQATNELNLLPTVEQLQLYKTWGFSVGSLSALITIVSSVFMGLSLRA